MTTPQLRPLWLILAPVIFLILWSAGFAIAKLGLTHAPPLTMLALRYCIVVALLLPVALVMRPPLPVSARAWADVAIVGFLIQVVYFALCYIAFKMGVSAGGVAIVVCLQPILVALISPKMVGELVGVRGWIGLALGLAGAVLTIAARSAISIENVTGLLLTVGALFGITGGTLWEKKFGSAQHPLVANLIQYSVGAVCTLPLAALTETMRIDWNWEFVGVMAYLVLGNSIVAIGLLLAMIRRGAVAKVSALFYLVPPLSALFAWPLLGEAMPLWGWVGMVLAAAGVAIVSRRKAA